MSSTPTTGTLYLTQKVGRDMRRRGQGRILITGSIAGLMPDSFQAVYNGTKAIIDSFSLVAGWKNKLQTTMATVTPSGVLASQHRKLAEPGAGKY